MSDLREGMTGAPRERMGGMAAEERDGARLMGEADELAIDLAGERAGGLERKSSPFAELPAGPKSVGATWTTRISFFR